MRTTHSRLVCFATVLLFVANFCRGQQLTITPDRTNGVYQVGDIVHWQIDWNGDSNPPPVHYAILKGGLTPAGDGDLDFSNGVAQLATPLTAPGTVLLKASSTSDEGRKRRATAGAVAAPDRIPLSAVCPADFDAFWRLKVKELKKVPVNARLESVDVDNTNLAYWKITLDNIRGTHIEGQLARPARGGKLPALLIVQWAGVYPLQKGWVTDRAAEGWLALNIEAHDLPIDQPPAFYREQFQGPLKNYWSIGNDDRDKSYFLRMYLSAYRAAEYLIHRKDWNGKTLVVMGDSQGGQQTLMLAGLHPKKITAALALVPAGCDMLGPDIGRAPGWPNWYSNTEGGKDPEKVHEASRYYDTANFASRIRCPVLVGTGLRDETCPPAGVMAAFNQIAAPKQLVILPRSGHQDEHGTQAAYNQLRYSVWLPALREGNPAPVAQ